MSAVRFVLPPSLGASKAGHLAEALQAWLAKNLNRDVTVYVAPDYAGVEDDLLFGSADVAWAPPYVCARLQGSGALFLLHAVRNGASRYRAGLVCRKGEIPKIDDVTGLRAVWVSPDSTAGYLLPRQWFNDRGIDTESAFSTVRFAGSYQAAVRAVIDGEADVTSVFATAADVEKQDSALSEVSAEDRAKLEIFAFTAERLNDGIVFAPECDRMLVTNMRDLLKNADSDDEGKVLLQSVFNAQKLVSTEAASYGVVYSSSDEGEPAE